MIASPTRKSSGIALILCKKTPNPIWFPCHPFSSLCERRRAGLLDARRTYSSALCVMDGDRAWIGGCICDFFFHDIIAVTLSWSEAFDLTGVGPYFGHPQPPYRLGMALIPPVFSDRPTMQPAERTLWLSVFAFISP